MRKIAILILLISFSFPLFAQQMSDEQVIMYLMQAQGQGMSQQQMATELLKKGATMDQLKRIREKYSESDDFNARGSSASEMNDRTRKTFDSDDYSDFLGPNRDLRDDPYGSNTKDLWGNSTNRKIQMMVDSILNEKGKKVFGRDIFKNRELTFEPNLGVATPLNYQLGPGDEVIIDVWGASQTVIREIISPDGTIVVENLGPVYLNGLTIKDANSYLKREFSKVYSGITGEVPTSQINLTLGSVRTIQVNIMGEVKTPGTYTLSSFATVFHALYQANGVSDIGSLRKIKVYRDNKEVAVLDIYEYLMDGKMSGDIQLRDNDVILVEPYQNLINLDGKVKRPMFYEMKIGETIEQLFKYSGGFTGDAYKRNVRLIRKSGREHQIYNVAESEFGAFSLHDGDSLYVDSVLVRYANRVEIRGAVYRPGMFQMDGQINTLKKLIEAAEGVREDAFLNRGVLHREKDDLTLEAIAVNIRGLLNGDVDDIPLKRNDVFFIPSLHELREYDTFNIHGQVANPGTFPYASNTTLEDLILQAGGLLEAASTVKVDVSRRIKNPLATTTNEMIAETYTFSLIDGFVVEGEVGFTLEPFDEVYVRRSPGYHQQQNIEIQGEVLFEGTYALTHKNQRLSEVINNSGGLTPEAYAKGARLERRLTEEEKNRLETFLRTANSSSGENLSAEVLELGDYYLVGIELDKALAYPGSDADVVLKEGDRIIVPQFTSTVKINGSVMHPNTVTYNKGKDRKYYIDMAGGYALRAKKNRAYVIYMNGTVARLKAGNSSAIHPGCEIIIPSKGPKRGNELLSLGLSSTATLATLITALALLK